MPLNDLEQRVRKAIARRRDDLLRDLARHVAIPTGHNFKPGLDQYRELLLDRLRALSAKIEYIEGDARPAWLDMPGDPQGDDSIPPTALARLHNAPNQSRILIAGHLDTVHEPPPKGAFRELSISPDKKTAIGPGAVDMKGGILIALAALEALAECGVKSNWTFLLNSDEETGSFHSFQALRDAAREHDIGLALEPAMPDGGLVVQRIGSGQFKVEVFGKAAHVGRDFAKGVSAVTQLGEIIVKLAFLAQPEKGVIVNVGPLVGGAATNIVPEYAACWGNMRFADATATAKLAAHLDALVTGGESLPKVILHRAFNRPAKPLLPPVEKLADAARAAAQDLNQKLPLGSTGGVCDGNNLQDAGLPTIDTLGVRGGNLHRTDEFVEIASLVERAQLLAILVMRLSMRNA